MFHFKLFQKCCLIFQESNSVRSNSASNAVTMSHMHWSHDAYILLYTANCHLHGSKVRINMIVVLSHDINYFVCQSVRRKIKKIKQLGWWKRCLSSLQLFPVSNDVKNSYMWVGSSLFNMAIAISKKIKTINEHQLSE